MAKHLPAQAIRQTAEFHYQTYVVDIPEGHAFSDLFVPTYWGHHKRLNPRDMVRAVALDGSFDVMLTVTTRGQGGVVMALWPKMPAADRIEAAPEHDMDGPRMVNGKPVPRVDHTKATKWRVIGLDNQEHSSGYATKAEAEAAMRGYMRSIGLELENEPA